MLRVSPRASLIGLALAGATIAAMLVGFVLTMGGQGTPKAYAIVTPPTNTPTPTCVGAPPTSVPYKCLPKGTPTPKGPGSISGVYDISTGDPTAKYFTIYTCMARIDEYAGNTVKSAQQCYTSAYGDVGDPFREPPRGSLRPVPPNPNNNQSPPPPPPYTTLAPQKGYGNIIGGTLHTWTCFADIGGILGPNLIFEVIIPNFQGQIDGTAPNGIKRAAMAGAGAPGVLGNPGTGLYLYGYRSQLECDGVASGVFPTPDYAAAGGFIQFSKADSADPQCAGAPPQPGNPVGGCALAAWRVPGNGLHGSSDWDDDGCTDSEELWTVKPGAAKCGDDPWNPNDVNLLDSDVSGIYSMLVTAAREDVCKGGTWKHQGELFQYDCTGKLDGTNIPGFYYTCDAHITQNVQDLNAKVLCYIDFAGNSLLPNGYTVNPDAAGGGSCNNAPAAPDMCGNGSPGAAPPGCNPIPYTSCGNTMPNASNMVTGPGHCAAINKGPALFYATTITCHPERWLFAQISNPGPPTGNPTANPKKQNKLVGTYNKTTNMLELSGCFNNNNARVPDIAPVYVRAKINAHTGHGFVSLWNNQDPAACKTATFNPVTNGPITLPIDIVRQACDTDNNRCYFVPLSTAHWDTDGDGCIDARELSDTAAGADGGGMRDPSNRWDFFDPFKEAVPVGGLHKHTATDMLVVQQHFGANEWIKDPANPANPPVLNDGVVNPAIKAYSPAYDRTAIVGSNAWNLGPGDGYINAHDMLAVQKSFGHTCPQTLPTGK